MKKIILAAVAGSCIISACNFSKAKEVSIDEPEIALVSIERGEYLVKGIGCADCHSPKIMTDMGPEEDPARMLSGHPADAILPPYDLGAVQGYALFTMDLTAAIGPWGTSFAANLTPHETGLGNWTEEQFLRAMKEGQWKGLEGTRKLLPPMPWPQYRNLTDDDIKSIFAYLKSIPAVDNVVPLPIPPAGS